MNLDDLANRVSALENAERPREPWLSHETKHYGIVGFLIVLGLSVITGAFLYGNIHRHWSDVEIHQIDNQKAQHDADRSMFDYMQKQQWAAPAEKK